MRIFGEVEELFFFACDVDVLEAVLDGGAHGLADAFAEVLDEDGGAGGVFFSVEEGDEAAAVPSVALRAMEGRRFGFEVGLAEVEEGGEEVEEADFGRDLLLRPRLAM